MLLAASSDTRLKDLLCCLQHQHKKIEGSFVLLEGSTQKDWRIFCVACDMLQVHKASDIWRAASSRVGGTLETQLLPTYSGCLQPRTLKRQRRAQIHHIISKSYYICLQWFNFVYLGDAVQIFLVHLIRRDCFISIRVGQTDISFRRWFRECHPTAVPKEV